LYNKVFYGLWTTPESSCTKDSSCAKRPESEPTSPDKLTTEAGLKQLAQVEEHIWVVLTQLDIEATEAVKTAVFILIADILVQESELATTLPEVPSKEIVAWVFNVPLGDKNIFCK